MILRGPGKGRGEGERRGEGKTQLLEVRIRPQDILTVFEDGALMGAN